MIEIFLEYLATGVTILVMSVVAFIALLITLAGPIEAIYKYVKEEGAREVIRKFFITSFVAVAGALLLLTLGYISVEYLNFTAL